MEDYGFSVRKALKVLNYLVSAEKKNVVPCFLDLLMFFFYFSA